MKNLKNIAKEALSELTKRGADRANVKVTSSETREFNIDNGKFSLFRTLFDNSLSMTALKASKKGNTTVNRFDSEAIANAAAECIAIANSAEPDSAWDFAPKLDNRDFDDGVVNGDIDKLFYRTKELLDTISERYPLITIEQCIVSHEKINWVYMNTYGAEFERRTGQYSVMLMYSAHDGELASSFFDSSFTTISLDRPFIECATVAKDLADVSKQIHTISPSEKFTGVAVLPPSVFDFLLESAISSFASDSSILDGTSIWRDLLGKPVASEKLSVKNDPYDESIVNGERITSEGFVSEAHDIIKNGVLDSFLISLYVANKTGLKRAPAASLMMIVPPGDASLDEMIANIDRGIIIGRISGGNPASNGDFSGVAKNSFLIENGKITSALSETMISANIADMLKNIVALSAERVSNGDYNLPYAAIGGVTISGK